MLWDSDQVLIAIHPLNISALLNGMISVKPASFNNSTARFSGTTAKCGITFPNCSDDQWKALA